MIRNFPEMTNTLDDYDIELGGDQRVFQKSCLFFFYLLPRKIPCYLSNWVYVSLLLTD